MLQHNSELKSKIEQLWAGGISNPLTAIEQITYLLFMKCGVYHPQTLSVGGSRQNHW